VPASPLLIPDAEDNYDGDGWGRLGWRQVSGSADLLAVLAFARVERGAGGDGGAAVHVRVRAVSCASFKIDAFALCLTVRTAAPPAHDAGVHRGGDNVATAAMPFRLCAPAEALVEYLAPGAAMERAFSVRLRPGAVVALHATAVVAYALPSSGPDEGDFFPPSPHTAAARPTGTALPWAEVACAPLHVGVAAQLVPLHACPVVPRASFLAQWARLPCAGAVPVALAVHEQELRRGVPLAAQPHDEATAVLVALATCVERHVAAASAGGRERGQLAPCRWDAGAAGTCPPQLCWAAKTIWGRAVCARVVAGRQGARVDLAVELRCADRDVLAALLADAPDLVDALSAGVLAAQ